jgi:aminodeoxyfutalosine synthase
MGEDQTGVEVVSVLQSLAERVSAGDRFNEADAQLVLESRDLITIGMMADEVRRRLRGARTTFVRVYEVHLDAVPASLPSSMLAGEIRIIGAPASLDAAIAAVAAIRRLAQQVPVTGFSLDRISNFRVPLLDVAARLRDAGLDALAEIPVDSLVDADAICALRAGGLLAQRLTVHSYGSTPPLEIVRRAADLHKAAGGFEAFAPLPRVLSPVTPTTGYDDVKLVAMSRLVVSEIPSIQVDWPLYGPKLAQVALTMGADDIDGIAAFDPATLGSRRSALAEVTGNIRAAALEPAERNARFELTG